MIEFSHFSFTYRHGKRRALDDITLSIQDGEFVIVAGPSGCGKSTLCLSFNGIIPHMLHGSMEGEVRVNNRNTHNFEVRDLAGEVGIVFQNPDNQIFAMTVEEDVAFGPENIGMSREDMISKVEDALSLAGLQSCRKRPVHRLSGGQKQRTAIAGIYALSPDILVFDEPTADLDPSGTQEVFDTIRYLHKKEGKTIILIEHKLKTVLPYADRLLFMNEGKITHDLVPDEFGQARSGVAYPSRKPKPGHSIINGSPKPAIILDDVHYHYPDGTPAVNGVSLEIITSEFVAITGENGSGKSTLGMLMKGMLKPDTGTVKIPVLQKDQVPGTSTKIGYLFQNPDDQIVMDRVDKEIACGLHQNTGNSRQVAEKVRRVMDMTGLPDFEDRDPNTLSRGERQRLAVASIIVTEPEILIFDEPTTGQDTENLARLMNCIVNINGQHTTMVMITHDLDLAHACADRIIVMKEGRIVG